MLVCGYVAYYKKLALTDKVFRRRKCRASSSSTSLSPKMSEFRAGILMTVLLVAVALSSTLLTSVEAARRLPEGQYAAGHRMLHERARSLIMAWVAQLTQGPSPRGPGH